jgi:hypothetical protein
MNLRFTLTSLALLLVVGCSDAQDDADPNGDGAEELDLTASTASAFTVRQSTGFMPPPPAGQCRASGQWTVSFVDETLTADACVGGHPTKVNRSLAASELTTARAALAKVRTAPKPTSCPTDVPVASLEVTRGVNQRYYVEQRSACGGGYAVTSVSLQSLRAVLEGFTTAAVAAKAVVGATTCNGLPCFALKGTCVDLMSTSKPLTSYANVTFTYVPGPTYETLTWLDDKSAATSRATQRLFAWLTNYHGVVVDGARRGMSPYWDGTNVSVFVTATQTDKGINLTLDTGGGSNNSSCTLTAAFQ